MPLPEKKFKIICILTFASKLDLINMKVKSHVLNQWPNSQKGVQKHCSMLFNLTRSSISFPTLIDLWKIEKMFDELS